MAASGTSMPDARAELVQCEYSPLNLAVSVWLVVLMRKSIMPERDGRTRLETEELVIGYAMSRLDEQYLRARQCTTWQQAYGEAATALSRLPTSFKNLRDELSLPCQAAVRKDVP